MVARLVGELQRARWVAADQIGLPRAFGRRVVGLAHWVAGPVAPTPKVNAVVAGTVRHCRRVSGSRAVAGPHVDRRLPRASLWDGGRFPPAARGRERLAGGGVVGSSAAVHAATCLAGAGPPDAQANGGDPRRHPLACLGTGLGA